MHPSAAVPQAPCSSLNMEQRILRMIAHLDAVRADSGEVQRQRVAGLCLLCRQPLPAAFVVIDRSQSAAGAAAEPMALAPEDPHAIRLNQMGATGWNDLADRGITVLPLYICECMSGHVRELALKRIATRIQDRIAARAASHSDAPSASDEARSVSLRDAVRTAKRVPFGRHALAAGVEE